MAAVASNGVSSSSGSDNIPQWKKDLISRLRSQNKKSVERLWVDHHSPHNHTHHPHPRTDLVYAMSSENGFGNEPPPDSPVSSDSEDLHYGPGIVNRLRNKYLSLALRESSNRPTILRKATSLENLLDDDGDEEDVEKDDNRLFVRRCAGNDGANRYRSSSRRQEMKRARSVEVISRTNHEEDLTMTSSVTAKINNRQSLHEDLLSHINENKGVLIENTKSYKKPVSIENGTEDAGEKYSRRINRPKRISPLLNEREKPPVDVVKHAKMIFEKRPETRTKKPLHTGEVSAKINSFNSMIVKTKLAATKPAWKRAPKPVPNGEVAAKVDSFNDIIVKTKVALKSSKPAIKTTKPVLNDKLKSNTHHHVRPVAKPVIISEEIAKPKTLELKSPKHEKKGFNSLPSPIPDVSRVDIKHQDVNDPINSLCETPDLILTSSPLPKITSPTYRKRTTDTFIKEERIRGSLGHTEATNKFISPAHSPTKTYASKPNKIHFNRDDELDSLGIKMISPISQNNITKNSASSVFNFLNSAVDQKHLPLTKKNSDEQNSPVEHAKPEINGYGNSNKIKVVLSPIEAEKNLKNTVKFSEEPVIVVTEVTVEKEKLNPDVETKNLNANKSWQNLGNIVEKNSNIFENLSKNEHFSKNKPSSDPEPTRHVVVEDLNSIEPSEEVIIKNSEPLETDKLIKSADKIEVIDRSALKPVQNKSASDSNNKNNSVVDASEEKSKIVLPKKTKPRLEESGVAVFNFTSRKDVPDYISNDTSRTPMRPVIPKPDEPGIKLLPEALLTNFKEIQEVWEEDELIKSLEARPPSPCDVIFINDNVLIDGKSSLNQSTSKRVKMKISFVADAEIFEYPSETSMLFEDSFASSLSSPSSQVGHTVPTLSDSLGSSLASYTPKTTEDFQLGITKSFQEVPQKPVETQDDQQQLDIHLEVEKPVLFSSGSTSDILF